MAVRETATEAVTGAERCRGLGGNWQLDQPSLQVTASNSMIESSKYCVPVKYASTVPTELPLKVK